MLQSWLQPISSSTLLSIRSGAWHVGSNIEVHNGKLPKLSSVKIAIIGLESESADAIRKELYPLAFPFKKLKIADLGNLRNHNKNFITSVLKELIEGGIVPILIGKGSQTMTAQFYAHKQVQSAVNMLEVDERVRYDAFSEDLNHGPLNEIFKKKRNALFHYTNIGLQGHFVEHPVYKYLEERNFDFLKLGAIRSDFKVAEPFVRDADFMSFNVAALNSIYAPGQDFPTPNGLTSEDACQLCRYAGNSDKLKSFSIHGFTHQNDIYGQTAQLIAQMVWYFIDGFYDRKNDFPASKTALTEYVVAIEDLEYEISFWKSNRSGRWWIQVPAKTKKNQKRHELIPCTYADYEAACMSDLPARLLKAFRRFE